MNARIVPAARGAQWILEGARMFAAAPLGWMVLAFIFLGLLIVLLQVPVLGPPLFLILYPGLTVGFMVASRASALRQPVQMQMLMAGFKERAPAQLALGGLYLAGSVLALVGASLVDGSGPFGALFGQAANEAGRPPLASGAGMAAVLVLMLPTAMAVFFAPMLVAWHALPSPKAAFFSFISCLLNWRAFSVYLALGLVLLVLLSNVALALVMVLAGPQARANPASLNSVVFLTMMPVALPVMMSSFYASYRDLFGASGSS
jgi:hypothetical protein